jgi:hypothetical protein
MKSLVINVLSAILVVGGLSVANVGAAAAQARSCFQGDTMDRDGGQSGALGAPTCGANTAQRIVIHARREIV